MGLQMRRVTWAERPGVDRFAARLGERLHVGVRLDVHRVANPANLEGRDTLVRVVEPGLLARRLEPLEWGDGGALLLAPLDVVSGAVLGVVVVTLVDLGAHFEGELLPEWYLTFAQIRARYGLIPAVGRWLGPGRKR